MSVGRKFAVLFAYFFPVSQNEAGLAGAPAKAVSAVKEMNIPQKIKDINIKLPDMPSLGNLKFLN